MKTSKFRFAQRISTKIWTDEFTYIDAQCGQWEGCIHSGHKEGTFIRYRNKTTGTALDDHDNLFDFYIPDVK